MTVQTTALDPARVRRARIAVSAFFLTNGALYANLLPRLPEVKDAFGLSNTLYGLLVVAFPLGAILVGALPARAIRRFGSGRVAAIVLDDSTARPMAKAA